MTDKEVEIYGLMSDAEEEEWECNRTETHELYKKLSENTKIKFGCTYLCIESFRQQEPLTYCFNVFTKGNKYYCHCPNQLIDDHNSNTVIDESNQNKFIQINSSYDRQRENRSNQC